MTETQDWARRGELVLTQPKRGYRFTVDALLLADFAAQHIKGGAVADLGAGCGIVGLLVLHRVPKTSLTAIELQPRLAGLARRNLVDNGFSDRGEVIELDLADQEQTKKLKGARFDFVVSNPPYQAIGRGATSQDEESAIARHEVRLPLPRLVAETKRLLRPQGRAAFIYPAARLGELIVAAQAVSLAPTELRLVHARPDAQASRALLLCEKSGAKGRLEVRPPLVERDEQGNATAELRAICGDG